MIQRKRFNAMYKVLLSITAQLCFEHLKCVLLARFAFDRPNLASIYHGKSGKLSLGEGIRI